MGLRKLLKGKSSQLTWSEPLAFRIRLRGDFPIRILIALGACLSGIGFMFALRWLTAARASDLMIVGFGLVPGTATFCCLTMMRGQSSGNVDLRLKEIYRQTSSYAVFAIRSVEERFRFDGITRCEILRGEDIGHSFSVLRLTGPDFEDVIGLPKSVNVKQVAKILHEGGLTPEKSQELPDWATKPMGLLGPSISLAVGAAVLCGGLWLRVADPANPNPVRQNPFQARQPAGGPNPAPAPAKPPVVPAFAAVPKPKLTEVVGGAGGISFKRTDPLSRPVLGVRFIVGTWAGAERVTMLSPIFAAPAAETPGTIAAKDGYALGAIHVAATDFVDGVTLEFMKLREDGSLDTGDSYRAEPIGSVGDSAKTISGDGLPVIGLHGRGGPRAVKALGLVLLKK